MEAKKFLEADYLDIVFENRNKAYGGYELRTHYARRVKKAGLFALLGVASLVSFSFISSRPDRTMASHTTTANVITEIKLPTTPPPPTPPVQHADPPPSAPTKVFSVIKVVDDNEIIEKQITEVHDLINATPGVANNEGDSMAIGSSPVSGKSPVLTVVTPPAAMPPMTFVEQMPAFAGDLSKYLSDNIRYPDNARTAGVQGRVIINFVVNENGAITDLKMIHGIGSGCDEEAIRVIKAMPKWKPGKNNGMPVKVFYTQAIQFQLD